MERPAKRARIDFLNTVTVHVRPWAVFGPVSSFSVPRQLFKSQAKRFGDDNCKSFTLDLPSASTFSTYLQLLYTREVVLDTGNACVQIMNLYNLSKDLGDAESSRLAMEELRKMLRGERKLISLVDSIYYESKPESEPRQILMDCAVKRAGEIGNLDKDQIKITDFGIDFVVDVAKEFAKRMDQGDAGRG